MQGAVTVIKNKGRCKKANRERLSRLLMVKLPYQLIVIMSHSLQQAPLSAQKAACKLIRIAV